VLLWTLAAICAVLLLRELPWAVGGDYRDFGAYYLPADLLRRKINPYAGTSWGDTPSWLLCFEPLTMLARFTAYKLWFFVNLAAFAITLILLLRQCAMEATDKWILAALIVLYPPIACNFWFAQSEVFLLFLLVLFILELQHGRDVSAGMILAAASLLRAYPVGLIGYLAARRKWKAVGYTIIGCIGGMTITIALVGTEVVTTYILNIIGPHSLNQPMGFLRHPTNLSLSWFVRFLLLHGFGIAELSPLASSLALIAGLLAAAFAFVATWRLDEDFDWRGYSLWVVTVSILSPIMWGQFMVCFVIVFVAIANGPASRRTVIAAVGSYVILTAFGGLHGYPLNFVPEFAQSYFARNIRVLHVLPESVTVSLILLYLSCCWFVFDNKPLQSTRMSITLASQPESQTDEIGLARTT
jgi:Glycosyltransferase family 87